LKKRGLLATFLLLLVALALVAAGCGGGDDDNGGSDTTGSGGGGDTLKIVSDLPLQGSDRVQTTQMVRAIQFVLKQANNKAGDHNVSFESFDDSTAAAGKWDEAKCAENARTYVDQKVVAVIGTYNSGCAAIIIPILNEVPIAMVSPANTAVGLTHTGASTSSGEPDKYFPSGERNYVRVVASDDNQGKIGVQYMKKLGVKKVYILDDKELYGQGVADEMAAAAKDQGLAIAGQEGWDPAQQNYRALMTKIKASGADGIYIGGISTNNGGQLLKDKVAIVGDNKKVPIIVSDGFVLSSLFDEAGKQNVEGVYGTAPTLPLEKLGPKGKQFIKDFEAEEGGKNIEVYSIYAAAAAQAILDAIAKSDGTQADIVAKIKASDLADSVIGSVKFDDNGDVLGGTETVYPGRKGKWVFVELAMVGR
jgi:branched-chain amino acid transport system substrate-binding protein